MAELEINPQDLDVIREFIREKTGIFIAPEKTPALQNSLQIRLQTVEHSSLGKYLNFIKYHPDGHNELKEIIKLITITKSDFFRNPPQFEALEKWILPELMKNRENQELAIWSAGCSTGEEPYSIALSLLKNSGSNPPVPVQILATDINQEVLNQAQEGVYPQRRLANIPQSLIQRYFQQINGDKFKISDPVKKMIKFQFHNLASSEFPIPAQGSWDIIFCRNVSIYFNLNTTRNLMEKFYEVIAEGGYLFIGHSESLFRVFDRFKLVEKGNVLIYRKQKPSAPKVTEESRSPAALSFPPEYFRFPEPLPSPSEPFHQPPEPSKTAPSVPDTPPLNFYQLSLLEFAELNYQQGLSLLNNYIQENPQKPIPYLTRGNIQTELGQFEEAIKSYQTAIELDPLISESYLLLGIALRKKGDLDNAINFFKRGLFVNETLAPASFMLGLIYRDLGNYKQAIRELSYAIWSVERYDNDYPQFIGSYWCPDDRPILEKNLLIKTCREIIRLLQKQLPGKD
ncbi:MAG: tetratricopeptide repeat protein [Proteobacteria bacterium]|nr:tetratricopeptide repeat protein [Pseudomonadota bacterium]